MSKTIDGVVHQYIYSGTQLQMERWGGNWVEYFYDENGNPTYMLRYDEAVGFPQLNYFVTNLQGDVIGIVDKDAKVVAKYSYDAWGVCTVISDTSGVSIATINPFRYRGYYYDIEIGMYYLQSRYFNPSVGRFINSDEIINLGAGSSIRCFNVFIYAENNPISMIDEDGRAAINIICAAIGAVVGWFFGDWVAKKLGYYSGWKYWAIRAGIVIGGTVIGWFAGTLIAKLIATYLKCNPGTVFRISSRLGPRGFKTAMEFLGINPFTLAMDASKFIAIA